MKNKSIIIGLALMFIALAIPSTTSTGSENLFSTGVWFALVVAFAITVFFLQRKMHTQDRELVRKANSQVPNFFYYPKD
jgi:uncharacterized membrane protein